MNNILNMTITVWLKENYEQSGTGMDRPGVDKLLADQGVVNMGCMAGEVA